MLWTFISDWLMPLTTIAAILLIILMGVVVAIMLLRELFEVWRDDG